jgi:hypothetical protein
LKFSVPFVYTARYRHHRHRLHQYVRLQSSTLIEIAEVPTPGRPAFELGHAMYLDATRRPWQRFRLFEGRPARVWRLEDGCFAEYCPAGDFENRVRDPHDNCFDARDDGRSAMPFKAQDMQLGSFAELSRQKRVMEWDDDGGSAKAACIARRAAAMRIIDGMVCVSVSEPVVVVKVGREVSVGLAELAGPYRHGFYVDPDHFPPYRRYRIGNLEEAERYARRVAREKGLSLHSEVVVHHAEPSSPSLCEEGEHLWQTAEELGSRIRYWGFDAFVGESTRARLHKALAETPKNHATTHLAEAAKAVLEELQAVSKDDLPFPEFLLLVETIRALESDLCSWQRRDRSDDDFSDRALPMPVFDRGLEQILSRTTLHDVAESMRIPPGLLDRESGLGNILVRYATKVPMVAVLTPELAVKCLYGSYGRVVPLDEEEERFASFLAENRSRFTCEEDDLDAFAGLQFD